MEKKPQTLLDLNDIYRRLFYIEDDALIPLLATTIISAKANTPAVWMYLIGPSSGGKTSALSIFNKVPFLSMISDFTPNTLLSGARSNETETSLLKKLGDKFVVVMKDFTTILSKSEDTQDILMSQLREVYDGHMIKFTGMGIKVEWGTKEKPSKGVFLMASTEGIYKIQEKFSEMGSRGLNYVLKDQDRIETAKMAMKKTKGFDETLGEIQDEVAEYIMDACGSLPSTFPKLSEELENRIIEVADFVSQARSIVLRDYRGVKSLALSAEFPMRLAKMMMAMAQIMTHLSGGELPEVLEQCIYKSAFDCIPKQTRLVLEIIAKYYRCDSGGVGREMNYPQARAQEWIENLNMFGIVERVKVDKKEYWQMESNHRKIIQKYLGIEMSDQFLLGDEVSSWGNYE
jgi:hypothetical protein